MKREKKDRNVMLRLKLGKEIKEDKKYKRREETRRKNAGKKEQGTAK